jgi:hypothetical protein
MQGLAKSSTLERSWRHPTDHSTLEIVAVLTAGSEARTGARIGTKQAQENGAHRRIPNGNEINLIAGMPMASSPTQIGCGTARS